MYSKYIRIDVHNLQSYSYCYFINIKFSELKRNRILNMHIYHFDDLNIERKEYLAYFGCFESVY